MPKDAQELFNEQIPDALVKFPDKAREVDAIFCFKVTGEGGGTWSVDLKADPPACTEGENPDAQCTIEVAHEDFKSMLSDPQAGMQLYFQGKLKVSGDPMLATKLQPLFDLAGQSS
jgi:putative sterol carrier protein